MTEKTDNAPVHTLNPFRPGAGRQPLELVGRMKDIDRMSLLLTRTKLGQIERGVIYYGLRGMGKTVLLNRMAKLAREEGMCVAQFEATGDTSHEFETLLHEISISCAQVKHTSLRQKLSEALNRVTSIEISFPIFKASIDTGSSDTLASSDSYKLELLIQEICGVLKEEHSGLFLFIDEFQEMSHAVMLSLLTIQHKMNQDDMPFFIVGAGLPNLQGVLTKTRSYAERLFEYYPVEKLNDVDAEQGFQGPAERMGRHFDSSSLAELVKLSRGYPYFIQTYGMATWDASDSDPITADAVKEGKHRARSALDHGLYESRWQRATPYGRTYLSAMAQLCDDECKTQEVAEKLDRTTSDLSVIRKSLIQLGLIYSPARGQIAFTVPGMAEYIRRISPPDELAYSQE